MVPVGNGNEVLGLLFIDSVLMLCSDYTAAQLEKTPLLDEEMIQLRASVCTYPDWVAWGNA